MHAGAGGDRDRGPDDRAVLTSRRRAWATCSSSPCSNTSTWRAASRAAQSQCVDDSVVRQSAHDATPAALRASGARSAPDPSPTLRTADGRHRLHRARARLLPAAASRTRASRRASEDTAMSRDEHRPPRHRRRASPRTCSTPCCGRRSSRPHGLGDPPDRRPARRWWCSSPSRWACTWRTCTAASTRSSTRSRARSSASSTGLPAWTRSARWACGAYASAFLVFNLAVLLFLYVILRLQGHLPLNPAHVPDMNSWVAFNTAVSFATNTNWQVYVPRDVGQLPDADARPRARELRLGRDRHRRRRRLHPRADAALDARARQLLGRPDAQHRLDPPADLDRRRRSCWSRRASCRTWTRPRKAVTVEGVDADDRAGPVRLAGDHQGARHERRRLLQRQLRAPLREPDAAHQPRRDAGDPRHPGRPHVHVRTVRRQPAAGLGAVRAPPACCSS